MHSLNDLFKGRFSETISLGGQFAALMFVVFAVGATWRLGVSSDRGEDATPYPKIGSLLTSLSRTRSRLALIIGFLAMFADYSTTVVSWLEIRRCPRDYLAAGSGAFFTCMFGWGVLWIADSSGASRPTDARRHNDFHTRLCSPDSRWRIHSRLVWKRHVPPAPPVLSPTNPAPTMPTGMRAAVRCGVDPAARAPGKYVDTMEPALRTGDSIVFGNAPIPYAYEKPLRGRRCKPVSLRR